MTQLVVYALVGKLLIFIFQKFPKSKIPLIGRLFLEGKFLEELFSCDLCLGVWVYTGLSFIFSVNILGFIFSVNILGEYFYVPILSEFITGMIVSFVMHLISAGWETRYQNIVIE